MAIKGGDGQQGEKFRKLERESLGKNKRERLARKILLRVFNL